MAEKFERHRQAWTADEVQKLHLLATKGMSLKPISKALTRSEGNLGAAAAALYGSRAASGVISITTARGQNLALGQTQFTLRSEYGRDFISNGFVFLAKFTNHA